MKDPIKGLLYSDSIYFLKNKITRGTESPGNLLRRLLSSRNTVRAVGGSGRVTVVGTSGITQRNHLHIVDHVRVHEHVHEVAGDAVFQDHHIGACPHESTGITVGPDIPVDHVEVLIGEIVIDGVITIEVEEPLGINLALDVILSLIHKHVADVLGLISNHRSGTSSNLLVFSHVDASFLHSVFDGLGVIC